MKHDDEVKAQSTERNTAELVVSTALTKVALRHAYRPTGANRALNEHPNASQ